MARDRYQVDIIIDPSRFLLEIPQGLLADHIVKPLLPASENPVALPESRYDMPAFLLPADGSDDEVN